MDSILQQTFSDFEFILVNDNPVREELDQMLADLSQKDRRIKVLKNPKNYGLAWSMNRAAAISRSPYWHEWMLMISANQTVWKKN